MTSFGWKKKSGDRVLKRKAESFEENSANDESLPPSVDWISLAPIRKFFALEDAVIKSQRLKNEGSILAEDERYWEALKKWDEAIALTPTDETLFEMKSQALTALCEVFPALKAAKSAVKLKPTWWVAHQTLGRCLLNLGEVQMAIRTFCRAIHINPAEQELWQEDLNWARSLLTMKSNAKAEDVQASTSKSSVCITEITEDAAVTSEAMVISDVRTRDSNVNEPMIVDDIKDSVKDKQTKRRIKKIPRNYIEMRDPS